MKKRKFNILLNIAVLCMCVCAIAIGVYSAKTASLNVSGTIGFTAHNCEIAIKGEMNAYEKLADGTNQAVTKYFNSTNAEGGEAKTITGSSNPWNIGNVCFDDLNTDKYHQINDISFTFEVTNMSAYYVDVTVDQNCIGSDRIFIYAPNNGETLAPKGQDGASVTLIVKFQLQKVNEEYSSITDVPLSNISLLNFTKSQAPAYLATDWKSKITDIFSAKSISFVNVIDESIKTNTNYTQTSVGAVNETSNQSDLTGNNDVTDVVAYYNSASKEVIIYSPARIYAPQNCREMFAGFSVSSLDISNFDTSKVTSMSSMFSTFYATSLDVSNFDTSKVTNMSSMFFNCYAPTSLDVSNFNTSNVTDMSGMFSSCKATSLDVSNFNTSNVTDMSSMFVSCNATSLDVSNFNTSSVTNMHQMFQACTKLTSLDVSNFDTSKVKDMSFMFSYCGKFTNLDLSNFDTSNATDMSSMFLSCSELKTIYVNSGKWVISSGCNTDGMFNGCGCSTVTFV